MGEHERNVAVERPAGVPIKDAGGLPAVCLYPPNRHAYIYTLSDPRTGKIRYVGKTHNVQSRFYGHFKDRRLTHKGCWIRGLQAEGLRPEMEVIDMLPTDNREAWEAAERKWIETFKSMGFKLTNLTDGGVSGSKHSPETIAKMRVVQGNRPPEVRARNAEAGLRRRGMKHSPESIALMRLRHANISEETRAKMRAAQRAASADGTRAKKTAAKLIGRALDPERKEKLRLANLGKKRTPEQRERMRLAALNQSPEKRARISAALTGRKRPQELCEKLSRIFKGRIPSESWRFKQSLAKKGKPVPQRQGVKFSEEAKANMRAAQQLRRQKEREVIA